MTLIPFAGKDPTENQVTQYRWPEEDMVRKTVSYPTIYVAPKPKPAAINHEEIRKRSMLIFRRRGMPGWAREIVEDVSRRTGVMVALIASPAKNRNIIKARNEAIYLVKARKPELSSPMLAKWFARDHTSCLHSLASHAELTGAPSLTSYDLRRAKKRNAAFSKSMREREAA